MPQAVIPALIAFGVSGTVAVLTWTAFTYIAAGFLLNKAMAALAKKPKRGHISLETNFAGTIEPRRIIFGTIKVGGMHNIPPLASGSDNEFGHADIIHCGHEVADVRDVWLDNDKINDGDIAAITGADTDGRVTTGKYANHINIRRYLGTSTQTADYILTQAFPTPFTSDFRLRGNTHTALRCKYNSKIFTGWPNLTALVDGYKVYDPRLDTTKPGGSGSHREDDPTTWAFSSNPALILRHFLVWEIGFSHAEAGLNNDSYIMAAANVCDVAVNIPGPSTQKRWTFNGQLIAVESWPENLRQIVDSMLGVAVYLDGGWYIYAGSWQTPDVTINQGDWIAPTTVQATANRDERWNFVRGWYVDPDRNWQRVECYPRRNSTYETDDGGDRIPVEIEMPHCASSIGTKHAEYEAQRRCEILLRKSRNQIKMTGRLRPEFAKLIPGNTVYVNDTTYGFSDKSFRIIAVETGVGPDDGGVDVALIEEGSNTWTDLAAGEYNTESVGNVLDPSATLPSLTADPVITVGATTIMFDISAGVPTHQPQGTEYVVIGHSVGTPATAGTEVFRGLSPTPIIARSNVNTMYYWMRAEVGTYRSAYRPNTVGIPAAPYLEILQNEFVLDPDFSRSTSVESLWRVTSYLALNSATIIGSGGIQGGKLVFTLPSTNIGIGAYPRTPPSKTYPGDLLEQTMRWRRTAVSSVPAANLVFGLRVAMAESVRTYPDPDWGLWANNRVILDAIGGTQWITGAMINSAALNTWQETRAMYRMFDVRSLANLKHIWVFFETTPNSYAGAGSLTVELDSIFVRRISQEGSGIAPQLSVTAAHVATRRDVGGHLRSTTGGVTINPDVFAVGDAMLYHNDSGATQSITAGSGVTFRLAGTTTTGSPRTMAVYGIVGVLCTSTNYFMFTGDVS